MICSQDVLLQQTVCSILALPELMLPFVHGISSWPLLLLLFHWWPYSVPACFWFDCQLLLGTLTCVLLEPLVSSSRHTDRCTHGKAVKLQTSCCSPFSIVVCFWRYCQVLIIGPNMKVWVEHCPSGVMTSCILYCWARFSFSVPVVVVRGFILRACTGRCSL